MGLLTQLISDKIERHHADEEKRKGALRSFYYDRIHDPNTDPEVRDQITGDYLKLLSPKAKETANRGFDIVGKLKTAFGMGSAKPQQQGPVPAPTEAPTAPDTAQVPQTAFPASEPEQYQSDAEAPQPRTAQSALREAAPDQEIPYTAFPSEIPTQEPAAPAAPATAAKRLQTAAPQKAQVEAAAPAPPATQFFKNYGNASAERTIKIKQAEEEGRRQTRLEVEKARAAGRPQVLVSTNWKDKDGNTVNGFQDKVGGLYTMNHDPVDMSTVDKIVGKTSTARPTILASNTVTLEDAKQLAENGAKFKDAEGNDINLGKAPAGMVLQRAVYPDGKEVFALRNMNDKVVKVGNVEYAVNPAKVQQLPQGAGVALGVANAPVASSHEVQATDASGNPIAQRLQSSRSPTAPGIPGRGVAPVAAPTGAPGRVAPQASALVAAPTGAPTGSRPLPGYASGQFNQALQRVTPVREAVTQLFGDPEHPEVKTLKDFASLGEKPEVQRRVGQALNVIFGGLEEATGGAHISAGAGPVGVSTGGVGSVLQNYFGVPQKVAEQKSEIMQKVMAGLTPEEREYVNASVAAVSTMIGLRSLTKAPATESTMKALERDIPLWGKNTFTTRDFADKMQHLGMLINNGAKGSEAILEKQSPGLLKHVQNSTGEMEKIKMRSPLAAPSKGPAKGFVKDGYRFEGGDPADKKSWTKVEAKK